MSSLYERLVRADQLLEVDMDEVKILDPDKNNKIAIGTKDLNGCSTLVIMDKGVILAHIAPMGSKKGKDRASTGIEHFQAQAKAAVVLMRGNRKLFDQSTTTWGIFARVGEDVPLGHYATWLGGLFEHLKIPLQQAYYDVNPEDRRERNLPTGSVVVLRQAGELRLFVEDRPQTPSTQRTHTGKLPALATASTSAGPTTEPTRVTGNLSAARTSAQPGATKSSGPRWEYRASKYLLLQDGKVLKQQSTPPERQPYFNEAIDAWAMVDGADKWINKDGRWSRA